jgi:hypothetical protein
MHCTDLAGRFFWSIVRAAKSKHESVPSGGNPTFLTSSFLFSVESKKQAL